MIFFNLETILFKVLHATLIFENIEDNHLKLDTRLKNHIKSPFMPITQTLIFMERLDCLMLRMNDIPG
jgi:hypothetical protein